MNMKRISRCAALAAGAMVLVTSVAKADPPPPRKIIAMFDGTQTFGTTKRAVNFYDVTDLSSPGVFGQLPLFSVWLGSEDDQVPGTLNHEDISSIAVNPVNGNVYAAAFDSGNKGTPDSAGDTQGDLDLYRIDYQEILDDFVTNAHPQGTMYAPRVSPLWMDTNLSTVPDAGDVGFEQDHPDHVGTTVFVDDMINKTGEVIRTEGDNFFTGGAPRSRDLEFINPEKLALLSENDLELLPGPPFFEDLDHQIRILSRVSTSQGAAVEIPDDGPNNLINQGGFNSPDNTESWESVTAAFLEMEPPAVPFDFSDPDDMVVVQRDGVVGVWVQDNDGGGDDLSFFELDIVANTGFKKEIVAQGGLTLALALDEDPSVATNTNDGDFGFMKINADGNLVLVESGFFDAGPPGNDVGIIPVIQPPFPEPALEPKLLTLDVQNYDAADSGGDPEDEVQLNFVVNETEAWTTSAEAPDPDDVNTLNDDDDIQVTEARFGVFDKGTGFVYFFDIDDTSTADDAPFVGGDPDQVITDVYVFDPATGQLVYEETDAMNHFNVRHGNRFFLRGDITGDGIVDEDDINALAAAIIDPTLGGAVAAALGAEWYDLTGEGSLTDGRISMDGDAHELIREILGTEFGDAGLNGMVGPEDYTDWANGFGGTGYENGDFNLNLTVGPEDYTIWANNFGFNSMVGPSPVPEPSSLALLGLGAIALLIHRRKRRC